MLMPASSLTLSPLPAASLFAHTHFSASPSMLQENNDAQPAAQRDKKVSFLFPSPPAVPPLSLSRPRRPVGANTCQSFTRSLCVASAPVVSASPVVAASAQRPLVRQTAMRANRRLRSLELEEEELDTV